MKLASSLAFTLACAVSAAAAAQSVPPEDDGARQALMGAVFAKPATGSLTSFSSSPGSTFAVRSTSAAPGSPVFAAPAYSGTRLDQPNMLQGERYLAKEGLVRWRTGETVMAAAEGNTVDSLRLSVGGVARAPLGGETTDEAFDLTYTRGWLSAFRGRVDGGLAIDVTPHAGFGVSNAGGSAIAGAMIRFGDIDFEDQVKDRLTAMGVPMVTDGARFGDKGRWYLFAAADGRAVGLNMARNETGGWSRQGLTTDEAAVIGEAQVGMGWRKGAMQASLGVIHREIKTKPAENLDEHQIDDQAVAFTLSIKPRKK